MTILLTETGWTDLLGEDKFWSESADFVFGSSNDNTAAVSVANGSRVESLGGNDYIAGNAQGNGIGLDVQGQLRTNEGSDLLVGYSVLGPAGIRVSGTIGTGQDSDKIFGQAFRFNAAGISVEDDGRVLTKAGADIMIGVSSLGTGISNAGIIEMDVPGEPGATDIMQGGGLVGVANSGSIKFGDGNDSLLAVSFGNTLLGFDVDLFNSGEIRMGSFGNMTIDAGNGVNDTLILPAAFPVPGGEFPVAYIVGINGDEVSFTAGGVTMTTTGFETLEYGGFIDDPAYTFNFSDLQNGQVITFVG